MWLQTLQECGFKWNSSQKYDITELPASAMPVPGDSFISNREDIGYGINMKLDQVIPPLPQYLAGHGSL